MVYYDQEMKHRLASVTKGDCQEAGRLMRRDAARLGFWLADEKIGNIDGGPWIIGQIQVRRMPMTAVGLDFYHLSDNVHKSRRMIFGEEDEAGKKRAERLLHVAKHEGYEPLREGLLELRKQTRQVRRKEGQPVVGVRGGPAGDDSLPRVSGQGMADRQRSDGEPVSGAAGPGQRRGDALGRGQRRGGDGVGGDAAEQPVGSLLADGPVATELTLSRKNCHAQLAESPKSLLFARHYSLKPRPMAVDAFRLCRSSVKNVCKRIRSVAARRASERERLRIPEIRGKPFPPPVFETVVTESRVRCSGA